MWTIGLGSNFSAGFMTLIVIVTGGLYIVRIDKED